MHRFFFFFFFLLVVAERTPAQSIKDTVISHLPDSAAQKDTLAIPLPFDSASGKPLKDSVEMLIPGTFFSLNTIQKKALPDSSFEELNSPRADIRKADGKEGLFYLLLFLLIIYAWLQNVFSRYISTLFRLFFRAPARQKQLNEQLIQSARPSLALNVFFMVTGGLYIAFLFQHYKLAPAYNFWQLFLAGSLGLSVIYIIKFAGLKASGWLINGQQTTGLYTSIVFRTNKIIGIILLPFLFLLAFAKDNLYTAAFILSCIAVGGLFVYRFVLTYGAVRNKFSIHPFHFFIYLCAFEIVPLLIIYKLSVLFFRITA